MTMTDTIDMSQILLQAYEVADMINASSEVQNYLKAKQELETDIQAQQLIREFQRKKEQFEETQRFGHFHPMYHAAKEEMEQFQRQMDANSAIYQFRRAEEQLDQMLLHVSETIAYSVSESIKVPSNNAFATKGGCGSGGSCNCG